MGFLDKLLGRKQSDADEGMQTAPPPPTMPEGDTHEHSHDEGEHAHKHEEETPPGGAS
jgi:ABC-type Zn2+ transport system substrate-binding protein/surface adhesin